MRRTCAVVSPPGSAPSPSTSSLLSMVSTSKWMATREQPVPASQSSSGWVASRSSSGLKARIPHWATLAMSSSAQACNPTKATRPGETVAGSSACTSGSPCPVNAATAMAWNPGYWLAGVPTSGVGVDPHDGQVLAIAAGQFREWGDTDRALAAQGDDPGRIVLADDLERLGELGEADLLCLDPVAQLQAGVVNGHRHGRGRALVGR